MDRKSLKLKREKISLFKILDERLTKLDHIWHTSCTGHAQALRGIDSNATGCFLETVKKYLLIAQARKQPVN